MSRCATQTQDALSRPQLKRSTLTEIVRRLTSQTTNIWHKEQKRFRSAAPQQPILQACLTWICQAVARLSELTFTSLGLLAPQRLATAIFRCRAMRWTDSTLTEFEEKSQRAIGTHPSMPDLSRTTLTPQSRPSASSRASASTSTLLSVVKPLPVAIHECNSSSYDPRGIKGTAARTPQEIQARRVLRWCEAKAKAWRNDPQDTLPGTL